MGKTHVFHFGKYGTWVLTFIFTHTTVKKNTIILSQGDTHHQQVNQVTTAYATITISATFITIQINMLDFSSEVCVI
jgi:hypothetical protein